MNTRQEITDFFRNVEMKARELFPTYADAPRITLSFNVRGRSAGYARWQGNKFNVDLNAHLMQNGSREFMENTITHEIAHIIAAYTGLGKGHDAGWKRIDRMLGGKGMRCFSNAETGTTVIRVRRTREHLYITPSGREVWIGTVQHNRLMRANGYMLRMKDTGERIYAEGYQRKSRLKD